MRGICKRFGAVQANACVDLTVPVGSIHGIVGENGAGKSTLMSILYGFYQADSGQIEIFGRPARIRHSRDAIALGVGMVHQHFMLVDRLSALDNIMLGAEPHWQLKRARRMLREQLTPLMRDSGLAVDLDALVADLPVGERQRLEILKTLYRGARILILDEPSAVLTPAETEALFDTLRALRARGSTVLLITHKLKEIMALCDAVTVMRGGAVVLDCAIADTSLDGLAQAMVGRHVQRGRLPPEQGVASFANDETPLANGSVQAAQVDLEPRPSAQRQSRWANESVQPAQADLEPRPSAQRQSRWAFGPSRSAQVDLEPRPSAPEGGGSTRQRPGGASDASEALHPLGPVLLQASHLNWRDALGVPRLSEVSLALRAGEIVGIAGVSGNGQSELLDVLSGMHAPHSGSLRVGTHSFEPKHWIDPKQARALRIAHVPEDRQLRGLVLPFPAWESAVLGYQRRKRYNAGGWMRSGAMRDDTAAMMERYDVRPRNALLRCSNFSGGNQQKLVLAREALFAPRLLLVGQPTRGVDIGAVEFIHGRLRAMRAAGGAVLLVSSELDEILALADRVIVMNAGRIAGELPIAHCSQAALGRLMGGAGH